jgi:hypothetical protein
MSGLGIEADGNPIQRTLADPEIYTQALCNSPPEQTL